MTALVVLRPEPGASATRARAEAAGWTAIAAPLFEIAPLDWTAPEPDGFDALLMTSAQAARQAGSALGRYRGLPLYAVGQATAEAARAAGFADVVAGGTDAAAIAGRLRADGRARILHLAGRETRPFDESGLSITRIAVYAAEPREPEGLAGALAGGAIVLLHSPRAAARFAGWTDAHGIGRAAIAIVAISEAALGEAGGGWKAAISAASPDDAAMLAAASSLGGGPAIG